MNDIDVPWGQLLIGLVFIVLFIGWGVFLRRFKFDKKKSGTFESEMEEFRKQMTPRGYKVFAFLISAGFVLTILIRVLQLLLGE